MKKVITYGTFDLLHQGHINLIQRAKALGDYLIVGVTSSDFDKNRGKINVKQSLMDRIEAVKDLGIADEVIPEEYYGQKIDDIRSYDVDVFAIGSDWKGHFDYLNEYCEVVYLDRTQGISSTQLRENAHHTSIGIVGSSRDTDKFIKEARYVSGVNAVGVFTDDGSCPQNKDLPTIPTLEELIAISDALYVANDPDRRFITAKQAMEAGCHVLSHSPVALAEAEAKKLFSIAEERRVVFQEAIKTAYALGFARMVVLVKSGMIGTPISIRSTCTSQAYSISGGSLTEWGPIACLPIFSILGTDYKLAVASSLFSKAHTDAYTKMDIIYDEACATFEVGSGVKSEGELVIAGTKGYVYVPAPWWKTDYFEVRFEDPTLNKRYFYQLDGEGIRNEISSFAKTIQDGKKPNLDITRAQTIATSRLMGEYRNRKMTVHSLGVESEGCAINFFQN